MPKWIFLSRTGWTRTARQPAIYTRTFALDRAVTFPPTSPLIRVELHQVDTKPRFTITLKANGRELLARRRKTDTEPGRWSLARAKRLAALFAYSPEWLALLGFEIDED